MATRRATRQHRNSDNEPLKTSILKNSSSRTTKSKVGTSQTPHTESSSSKRKRIHSEEQSDPHEALPASEEESFRKKQKKDEEKRLRRFRKHAPKSFLEKLDRARTQRMVVIGRTRSGNGESLQEDIDIVGSTGNIYKVTVGQVPTCSCPDSLKGNECKHKVYALHTVLKAPHNLQYQLAFLTDELQEIFSGAPPLPTEVCNAEENDGKRKPVEGECPICYMDMDEENNELVWCKAACGNNMHKSCFDQWAASQRGKVVKCVYCRTEWQMDNGNIQDIKKAGDMTNEGYVNVADQFGISRDRDYSSYNQYWVRRTFGGYN